MGSFVPTMARSNRTSRRKRKSFAGRPPVSWLDCASFFNEFLLLDEAAEILFVDQPPGERLDAALQLQQRERIRHQLEHDRMVFDLGPQPGNSRRENPAMIEDHAAALHRAPPRHPACRAAPRGSAPPRTAIRSAAERVPRSTAALRAEGDGNAVGAILPHGGRCRGFGEGAQGRQDHRVDHRRNADAPVLPGQIIVPVLPAGRSPVPRGCCSRVSPR